MLCFAENIPKSLQKVYKCIKKDLPRAATWIFSQNEKTGDLAFENMSEKDVVVVKSLLDNQNDSEDAEPESKGNHEETLSKEDSNRKENLEKIKKR